LAAFARPTLGQAGPVTVDTSQSPDLAAWARTVENRAAAWWKIISQELASPGYVPPDAVKLIVTKTRPSGWGGPGQADTIFLNAAFSQAHPEHLNYIAHDMVHVVQTYRGQVKIWLFTGIADYVRYYVLFPLDPERFFKPGAGDYRRGFSIAAALLDWVERTQGVGSVRRLNAAMREGRDGEQTLQAMIGMTLDEAWAKVLADFVEGSPAPHA